MTITTIPSMTNPNPAPVPGTNTPVFGAGVPANLTAANPYASPTPTSNMFGAGNNVTQMLFGGPAQSRSYSTSTTTKAPYGPTIGPINSYLAGTEQLYGGGAPQISPAEQQGYTALTAAGAGPSAGYLTSAANQGSNFAGGSLMNIESNPYLQQILGETGSQAMQDVNKTFGGAGRTGSGLNEWYGAQGATLGMGQLLNQDYTANLAGTINAITGAPSNVNASLLYPEAQISAGTGETLRPYMLNQNLGGILTQIAQLGGQTNTTQQTQASAMAQNGGVLGAILSSALSPNNMNTAGNALMSMAGMG